MLFTNKPQEAAPEDAAAALVEGKLAPVDIRNADERAEAHVAGSRLIPWDEPPGRLGELAADTPVAFVCRSGARSSRAAGAAAKRGVLALMFTDLARYFGVRSEHILETHNHADHVSGRGALAAATDATIHIHRAAGVDYPHESLTDGWELRLGSVTVRALHTPGHRPEHTAVALTDTSRGPAGAVGCAQR